MMGPPARARTPRAVLLEGVRGVAHSYALVLAQTALELLRRPGVAVYFRDQRPPDPAWKPARGLLSIEDEEALHAIPPPPPGFVAEATYRANFPLDLAESPGPGQTLVFGTSEHGRVQAEGFAGVVDPATAFARTRSRVLTPSAWSRQGFLASGAPPQRVSVHPHGVSPSVHRPLPADERAAARAGLGWGDDEFIFLHVSGLTENKNVAGMITALTVVAARHPKVRLVLKGLDGLYSSRSLLTAATFGLPSRDQATLRERVSYVGSTVPMPEVVRMMQAADAYLAPYTAEGFCLPVLEAAACGVPSVVTAGGPTDDFTTPEFALAVRSQKVRTPNGNWMLKPDPAELVRHMTRLVEDRAFRATAATRGPAHVHARYSWARVVDQLLGFMFPGPR